MHYFIGDCNLQQFGDACTALFFICVSFLPSLLDF